MTQEKQKKHTAEKPSKAARTIQTNENIEHKVDKTLYMNDLWRN
jgi:hypothetical protein